MPRYIKSLDGLRGLGLFFVLYYHYFGSHKNPWLGFAWIWVQMFFVQSGYLITKLLIADKGATFRAYITRFYWRRALRILPPYVAFLSVFGLAYAFLGRPHDFLVHFPYLATYTYNFTRLVPSLHYNLNFIHLWSLAIEEQFYLLWPLVIFFLSGRRLKQVLILIIILGPICRWLLGAYLTRYCAAGDGGVGFDPFAVGEAVYTFTLSQWDAFAFGAMIPVFGLSQRVRHPRRWALIILGLLLCGGIANLVAYEGSSLLANISALGLPVASTTNYQHVWSYSLVNLMFMFVILDASRPEYRGVFGIPPFVYVGKVAYGLYIYHFTVLILVQEACERFHLPSSVGFLLGGGLSLLVARLSYHFFEAKLLAFKDMIGSRRPQRAEPPDG